MSQIIIAHFWFLKKGNFLQSIPTQYTTQNCQTLAEFVLVIFLLQLFPKMHLLWLSLKTETSKMLLLKICIEHSWFFDGHFTYKPRSLRHSALKKYSTNEQLKVVGYVNFKHVDSIWPQPKLSMVHPHKRGTIKEIVCTN